MFPLQRSNTHRGHPSTALRLTTTIIVAVVVVSCSSSCFDVVFDAAAAAIAAVVDGFGRIAYILSLFWLLFSSIHSILKDNTPVFCLVFL